LSKRWARWPDDDMGECIVVNAGRVTLVEEMGEAAIGTQVTWTWTMVWATCIVDNIGRVPLVKEVGEAAR